ncbi:hypothetical protein [Halovivax limisalsi]|uniref:hypothetical protein n=1 Tax=Halovivax limisalsi TaxID=1453760 RepID=UPI001FFC489E|nr:hypothetical protein [Halovivax limisalsi]
MESLTALRWALRYRAMTAGAFVLGSVVFAIGAIASLGGSVEPLLSDPGAALEEANTAVLVAAGLLGLACWQLGGAFALFKTLPEATTAETRTAIDTTKIRSDVLEALDGRLTEMETDVEKTRYAVESLDSSSAEAFHEPELDDGRNADETAGERNRVSGAEGTTGDVAATTGRPADAAGQSTTRSDDEG